MTFKKNSSRCFYVYTVVIIDPDPLPFSLDWTQYLGQFYSIQFYNIVVKLRTFKDDIKNAKKFQI